jgi:transcriptional regulator with XRE-family HTH domain
MGRAGKALKRVLKDYGISQNQLAITMGIDRSNVSRWVSGSRDPSAEAVAQIKQALSVLKPPAAEDFVQLYLYEVESEKPMPAHSSHHHALNHAGNAVPSGHTRDAHTDASSAG